MAPIPCRAEITQATWIMRSHFAAVSMVPVFRRGKSGDDRARHARDLSARFKIQKKQKKYGGTKIITYKVVSFLSVRDWIKTKVVLWASVVKQFRMR